MGVFRRDDKLKMSNSVFLASRIPDFHANKCLLQNISSTPQLKFNDSRTMTKKLLVVVVAILYILHQDIWFWRTAHPLVFGFVPIGLFYQACFSGAAAFVMWLLVKYAWPSHLEREIEQSPAKEDRTS